MVRCDQAAGEIMSVCLLYRGDVLPKDVNAAIEKVKKLNKTIKFVEWCPTGFKVGINYQPPTLINDCNFPMTSRSVCSLTNTTAIHEAWERVNAKFDKLFGKESFLHWSVFSQSHTTAEYLVSKLFLPGSLVRVQTSVSSPLPGQTWKSCVKSTRRWEQEETWIKNSEEDEDFFTIVINFFKDRRGY